MLPYAMETSLDKISKYYNANVEREWQRLKRDSYHEIEFEVTNAFLAKFLPKTSTVVDVGCGPGRYAIELIRQGHSVALADLSAKSIDHAKSRIDAEGLGNNLLGAHVMSATNLGSLGEGIFDACLLFGPLYHLLKMEDRRQVIADARKVVRPGGLVFAAIINRLCPIRDFMFGRIDEFVVDIAEKPDELFDLAHNGLFVTSVPDPNFPDAYFSELDEVPKMFSENGIDLVETFGCEGMAAHLDEKTDKIAANPIAWKNFLKLLVTTATTPTAIGASEHVVFVGKVRKAN